MLLDDSQSASVSLPGPFWKTSQPKAALLHGYSWKVLTSWNPFSSENPLDPAPGLPRRFHKISSGFAGGDFALKVQFPLLGKQEVHLKKTNQTLNPMYVSLQFCSPFNGWTQLFIVRVWTCEWRMYSLTAVRLSISDSCSGFYYFFQPSRNFFFFSWGVRDI